MDAIGEYVADEDIDEMIRMVFFEGKRRVGYEEFTRWQQGSL